MGAATRRMNPQALLAVFIGLLAASTWMAYTSSHKLENFISDLIAASPQQEQATFCFTLAGSPLLAIGPFHHSARTALCPDTHPIVNTTALINVLVTGVLLPAVAVFRVDKDELAHHIVAGLFMFNAVCFIQCCVQMDRQLPDTFWISVRVRQTVLLLIHAYCWVYAIGAWIDPRLKPVATRLEALLLFSMLMFWASVFGIIHCGTLSVKFKPNAHVNNKWNEINHKCTTNTGD